MPCTPVSSWTPKNEGNCNWTVDYVCGVRGYTHDENRTVGMLAMRHIRQIHT